MRLWLFRLAAGALLFSVGLTVPPARAQQAPGAARLPRIEFEKHTLPNGLQLILHVDRKLPVVHVNQWFHVGSKNEKANRTGFAHLFEHMMFQGSKNAPGEYFLFAEKMGANPFAGGANGTTSTDRTNYFATVPSSSLETLLWLESDRLATMTDVLTREQLDNQRDVVKNERREGLENVPYGRADQLISENLHPRGHPYAWDVIGSHEDLTAATVEDVTEFFKTWYTPNNLSLVIAGDFDPAHAKRLVEKYFGPIPPGPALDRLGRNVPAVDGERLVEVKDRVPQERTYIVWPTPPMFEAGDAELHLVASILIDGLSSRLNRALVYDRQLASQVSAVQSSMEISSAFVVTATARPGTPLVQVEQTITEEIARLARQGPTAGELTRAKTKSEYQFVSALEQIGGFGGKADRLNMYNTYLGDPNKFDFDIDRYRNATVESVRAAAARFLATTNRVIVRFHPENSIAATQTVDRTVQPPPGADPAYKAPVVQSAKLPNGLELFVVERRELPKVAVTLTTRTGVVVDPADKIGLARLVYRTMSRGTSTRNALEIEDALGDLGTWLTTRGTREQSNLSLEVLSANLSPALTIFADVVRNPAFPAAEIEREKKITRDDITQELNNPNEIAYRVLNVVTFGAEHPYGRPAIGYTATLSRVTRDDAARFHATQLKPGNSALIFAGDITLARATELAREHFGGWTGAAPAPPAIPSPRPLGAGKVYLIDKPDAAQTVINQSTEAPLRTASEYYAFNLANAVWGGGFQTRLNLNLREDKGYSYGAVSYPLLYSKASAWVASAGVQTDKTRESLVEFVKELKGIAGERPITETELANARANRIRGYAQEFETLAQLVWQIANVWAYGLPMTELQRLPDETMRATLTSVNAAARRFAVPARTTTLLVGDRAKIEAGLRSLGLGEIIILDVEGKPIPRM